MSSETTPPVSAPAFDSHAPEAAPARDISTMSVPDALGILDQLVAQRPCSRAERQIIEKALQVVAIAASK